jgi:hypothetical protein
MRNSRLTTRNQIRDTLVTLLMSVALALVVWVFAMDQENPLIRQDFSTPIPISVRGLDPDLQTLQDLTQRTVSLNVRTSRHTWDSLAADDFSAVIDLSGRGPGSHDVDVIVSVVNPDIEILAQQPRQLRVQLESVITKTVPIVVDVVDSAALGYDWQRFLARKPWSIRSRPPTPKSCCWGPKPRSNAARRCCPAMAKARRWTVCRWRLWSPGSLSRWSSSQAARKSQSLSR